MDRLKDILSSVSERLSNPLIFSFLCAWVGLNWKVVLAVIFFSSEESMKVGIDSLLTFIQGELDYAHGLWWPLLWASLYTGLIPIIKNFIRALQSWCAKWGDAWNMKILQSGKVPIEKYLKLRENYEKRTQMLEEVIKKENEFASSFDSQKTTLLQTESQLTDARNQLSDLNSKYSRIFNSNLLDGEWIFKHSLQSGKGTAGKSEIELFIKNGMIFQVQDFGARNHLWNICDFHFDQFGSRELFFGKVNPATNLYVAVRLAFNGDDKLVGTEFEGTTVRKVEYRRKEGGAKV